jgi:transcriptional regulator with XRE-family HTH domain
MLAERIKMLRVKLCISQEELARRLGVSYRTILRWEQGETEPRGMLRDHVLIWLTKEENKQKLSMIKV